LGGGFGGVSVARELEKRLPRSANVRITLVNRDNFFLFTPMLHEVAASDLDITHIVNPLRKLLKRTFLFTGIVEAIDSVGRLVRVTHAGGEHEHDLEYDHLVIALGVITNFYDIPGLADRAVTMKSLGDAIGLRNRMIEHLEEADFECNAGARDPLLTFVVAGGGFAGVETVAAMHDFLESALRFYPSLGRKSEQKRVRVVLVHSGDFLLPELGEDLGRYTQERLAERGVEVILGARVTGLKNDSVILSDGRVVPARTIVWTAGTSTNPALDTVPCARNRGRIVVDEYLRVPGLQHAWALGDCASIQDATTGGTYPPTAQHAQREGVRVARNIVATMRGEPLEPFSFSTIGLLASIGQRTGVANILGVNFSGFLAWWLWRTIYLSKLPRLEKKLRVALDWTLDILFSKDVVQFGTWRAPTISSVEIPEQPVQQAIAPAGSTIAMERMRAVS
ncbi:MAG: NAD(P)/FAD-dependent oxidoreductase, partial [Gemmatimonadota bacterium]|nr:NAD(P)/FAD-dependent oxidoreductase [Gemmatimonadota bacterium]